MASKKIFVVRGCDFIEENIEFTYVKGMAFSQKQKCVDSLHLAILMKYPKAKVLEVSTKSRVAFSKQLSAFNLKYYDKEKNKNYIVECIFQSSKVFEGDVQYLDLLESEPYKAKTDEKLRASGRIIKFRYNNKEYKNFPFTLFYDWIYINALNQNKEIAEQLLDYDVFTDIEFNDKKSINCQARSCSIYVSLMKQKKLDYYLSDIAIFETLYEKNDTWVQNSLF